MMGSGLWSYADLGLKSCVTLGELLNIGLFLHKIVLQIVST